MKLKRSLLLAVAVTFVVAAFTAPTQLRAQEPDSLGIRLERLEQELGRLRAELDRPERSSLAQLRAQIEALTREIEEIKLGEDVVSEPGSGRRGLAPAASKVYQVKRGVSIGGYGELLYQNFEAEREDGTPSGAEDQFDALRAIVYVGYKFSDRWLFNSEIEFEHGSTGQAGSVSLEFAYLEYLVSESWGLRGGLLLAPMGFVNELHEPPTFLGTTRPETERQIIPSTWRENGLGFFGDLGDFSVRAYLLNGFDAVGGGSSKAKGFSATGLRGGRQKGSKAVALDFGGVARVDYLGVLGLNVGSSIYLGNAGQGSQDPFDPTDDLEARTLIWEGHLEYRARGLDFRGLFALAEIDDVEQLNEVKGLIGTETIGDRLTGWYLQLGYDVLRSVETSHQLIPFVRYEALNTQNEVPTGFAADPTNDREIISLGASWKPIPNVALKADYQIHQNEAERGVNQLNLAIGYLF